ncbi:Ribose-phosphate pyrophosphokinase 2, chloroplastic [Capsicum annuum]|nr:Ribose-phosphate pyrophosphokinase 2, chloroplastic [Capsicum annuum]
MSAWISPVNSKELSLDGRGSIRNSLFTSSDVVAQSRQSIAAKLVGNIITEAGADRVLACDLHSGQSMGYFDIPVDHVYCQPVILDYLASKKICSNDLVVVSPDVGGVARARAFAKELSAPLAIVDKRRQDHNLAEVMNLIGDVKGKVAVMVDDMIDTAGTIAKGAELLHEEGAREIYACCTHGVFRTSSIPFLSAIGQKTLSSSKLDIMGVLSCIGLLYKSDVKTRLEVAVFCQFHANTIAIFLFSALILVSNLVIMHIVCCSCLAIYVAILCVLSHDFAVVTVSLPYMLCDASSDTCFISFLFPPAVERLSSGLFQEVITTNTIPVMDKNYFPQLTVLSVANLLGETIWRIHGDRSVTSIFQ